MSTGLCLLAAAGLAGCGNGGGRVADDTQAHHFSMTLDRTQLPPGAQFLATYYAEDPGTVIGHGYKMALERDGKPIHMLINVEDPRRTEHAVEPPGRPTTAMAEAGPGPYRFLLPRDLDPGAYQVCVGLWDHRPHTPPNDGTVPRTDEVVCVDIAVIDDAPTTTPPIAPHFSMTLDRNQLKWRDLFFATYHVDDPSLVIRHDYHLYLERDGKPVSVTGGTAPLGMANRETDRLAGAGTVPPLDEAARARLTTGPGPYRFEFPGGVHPGAYQVCGRLWADKENMRFGESVCVDITVSE